MSIIPIVPLADLIADPRPYGLGGLISADKRSFPLQSVKVRAELVGAVGRTVVEQRFANPYNEALDVTYLFPLPEDGAVVELELRAGEIVVQGECQERQQARATFDAARAAGYRAALLDQERADIHTLQVANLPPRTEVVVRLVLVERLEVADGRMRWRFPTTIAPRFTPGTPIGQSGPGVSPDTDQVPDASRLQPPLRLAGGTKLDLEVSVAGPVTALESSLHAVRMGLDSGGVRVAPSASATLNKDFILAFSTADSQQTRSRAWTNGQHTVVVVEPPSGAMAAALPRDAVFVVDISGSMGGVKMDAAKRALSAALHGLVAGDRFRLIAFDDRVEAFRPDFVDYDARSLAAADAWISRLNARGGTVMLPAITEALNGTTPAGRMRTVLFITDGQATDEAQLVPAVTHRRNGAAFFTLGIDTAVNADLLKRLARVGGGVAELCTPYDDIEAVVARLEARFGSPLLTELTATGAARPEAQVVYAGRPAILVLEGGGPVTLSGQRPGGSFSETVTPQRIDVDLGAAWARERVAYLEDRLMQRPFEEEGIRPEILRIALQHRIASRYTSFVAVDKSSVVTGPKRAQVQPTELPEGWDERFRGAATSAPTGAAPPLARPAPTGAPMPRAARMMRAPAPASMAAPPPPPSAPAPAPGGGGVARKRSGLLDRMADALGFGSTGAAPPPAAEAPADLDDAAELVAPIVAREESAKVAKEKSVKSAEAKPEAAKPDVSQLARTQGADGSFGGDVARTAAALLTLLLLGHTRRKGDRQRVVQKAAAWLEAHRNEPAAKLALDALAQAEAGAVPTPGPDWQALTSAGSEGAMLGLTMGR